MSPPSSFTLPTELAAWCQAEQANTAPPALSRTFRFKTFRQAFAFMTEVALEAERANHHPDWHNSYNKVTVELTTHSEGRVTEKDTALAQTIELIYKRYM